MDQCKLGEKSKKEGQVVLDEIEALRKILKDVEGRLSEHDIDIQKFIKDKNLFIILGVRNYLHSLLFLKKL